MNSREVEIMLRLTVSTEEYLLINENIKIIFLGGTKNHLRIMVDAPREVNIVRSAVLKQDAKRTGKESALPVYYAEPAVPEKYLKPRKKVNMRQKTLFKT